MERRVPLQAVGVDIRFGSKVVDLIVEGGRVVGVRLAGDMRLRRGLMH